MKYPIIILSILFLTGCEQVITLPQPDYTTKITIQGIVEPDSFPIVYLNRTSPFLSATTQTGDLVVRNADVRIKEANTTDILKIDSVYDKIYCQWEYFYKGSIRSSWNRTYQLEILSDGQMYSASAQTNLKKAVIDSVAYTTAFNDVYGEHEGVIVHFKDAANSTDYYRYEQRRSVDTTMKHASIKLSFTNGCIGKDTISILEQGRSVYNDQNLDGQSLKIVVEPAYSHRQGLKTQVRMQAIDKAMYDFYDQLDKQKLAQYNPFVEPVFFKVGQFGEKAIGFFGSRTRSEPVLFVFPE
jgi:hypothetical protein